MTISWRDGCGKPARFAGHAARHTDPASPEASQALLAAFAERDINWYPERLVRRLDPQRRMAILADGDEMPFDLFLGVPAHRVPAVVAESGMCVDGWIPVDPFTLETAYPASTRSVTSPASARPRQESSPNGRHLPWLIG